ncbi:hypothetical protein ROA7450_03582 [Roseovarius albus]|uniref:Uncharacterized protein n=1 Tax=Roseovarius albus TaxID=1247867 RepID=A0A1X7A0N0_9RHOB|nr:hypothetical protein [Roseovarius albus]SLN67229.1 hypothetical protein ROA7450_03582 [Roseovarius albus]
MKVTMKLKPLLGFAVSCMIGLSMMGLNSKVLAEEAGENCPENPAKSGTITFSGQSTAVLVGVRWGKGVLTLADGQEIPFRARGYKGGEMGARVADINGEVYGLDNVNDFTGDYEGVSDGVVPIKGKGQLGLVNSKCVFIVAKHDSTGWTASAPSSQRVTIKFVKEKNKTARGHQTSLSN